MQQAREGGGGGGGFKSDKATRTADVFNILKWMSSPFCVTGYEH